MFFIKSNPIFCQLLTFSFQGHLDLFRGFTFILIDYRPHFHGSHPSKPSSNPAWQWTFTVSSSFSKKMGFLQNLASPKHGFSHPSTSFGGSNGVPNGFPGDSPAQVQRVQWVQQVQRPCAAGAISQDWGDQGMNGWTFVA